MMARDLSEVTDDDLRDEARQRGFELHSKAFSEAAQRLLRELPDVRRRLEDLEATAAKL